tara:strand:- start:11951 stop:13099 length:1149 start_codon:yes stop_codon:yes gene_type:complete
MSNINTSALIDKFLSNQLNKSEHREFNNLMETDSDFSKAVRETQTAQLFIHQLGLQVTSEKLNILHQKEIKTKLTQRIWSITAASILLITCFFYGVSTTERTESKLLTSTPLSHKNKKNTPLKSQTPSLTTTINDSVITHTKKQAKPISSSNIRIDDYDTLKKEKIVIVSIKNEPNISFPNDTLSATVYTVSDTLKTVILPQKSFKKTFTCTELLLSYYNTKPSCIGKKNGEIIFSETAISGGTPPYKTVIYSTDDQGTAIDKDQLASGEYSVKIIDMNGCTDTIPNITIIEKRCIKRIDVSFGPTYEETWEYPVIAGVSDYVAIIKDRTDNIILTKPVFLDDKEEWNGELDDGTIIQKGIYFIELKSQEETLGIGTITIIK